MEMMQQETVTFFDIYDAKAEWKSEGKEEGMIEKTVDMALKMMENGISLDIVQKCSGLNDADMEKLVEQYNKSLKSDGSIGKNE